MTHTHISKEEIHSFLSQYHLAVFGTTSIDNSPHLSTMFYLVDPDLNFYFITKSETAKVKNIAQNPHISVIVSDKDSYKTVEASGVAVALSGVEKIKTVIQMFSQVYRKERVLEEGKLFGWPPPIDKIEAGEIKIGDYFQEIISS